MAKSTEPPQPPAAPNVGNVPDAKAVAEEQKSTDEANENPTSADTALVVSQNETPTKSGSKDEDGDPYLAVYADVPRGNTLDPYQPGVDNPLNRNGYVGTEPQHQNDADVGHYNKPFSGDEA